MAETVTDALWEIIVSAGVRRCYGIISDALDPTIDPFRKNGRSTLCSFATGYTGRSQAWLTRAQRSTHRICGTAGPGTVHLMNVCSTPARSALPR